VVILGHNQRMSYRASDARQRLLDEVARAAKHLGSALADLGETYDRLDELSADRLEEQLFTPVRTAYGRAQRAYISFARRFDLPARTFEPPVRPLPADPGSGIERAAESLRSADEVLATLQDSMLPVEVGDPDLRADLTTVRELIADAPRHARDIVRTLGR
jgi:hypothetical protein